MIGGYLTFSGIDAKGRWGKTAVQDVLPVMVKETDDRMEHCEGVKPVTVKKHQILEGIGDKWPIVLLNDGESINPISTRYFDTVSASVIAVKPAEENLSVISNEDNREWWSLDIGYIGAFINSDDWDNLQENPSKFKFSRGKSTDLFPGADEKIRINPVPGLNSHDFRVMLH